MAHDLHLSGWMPFSHNKTSSLTRDEVFQDAKVMDRLKTGEFVTLSPGSLGIDPEEAERELRALGIL